MGDKGSWSHWDHGKGKEERNAKNAKMIFAFFAFFCIFCILNDVRICTHALEQGHLINLNVVSLEVSLLVYAVI